jgi:hypothetical protein
MQLSKRLTKKGKCSASERPGGSAYPSTTHNQLRFELKLEDDFVSSTKLDKSMRRILTSKTNPNFPTSNYPILANTSRHGH